MFKRLQKTNKKERKTDTCNFRIESGSPYAYRGMSADAPLLDIEHQRTFQYFPTSQFPKFAGFLNDSITKRANFSKETFLSGSILEMIQNSGLGIDPLSENINMESFAPSEKTKNLHKAIDSHMKKIGESRLDSGSKRRIVEEGRSNQNEEEKEEGKDTKDKISEEGGNRKEPVPIHEAEIVSEILKKANIKKTDDLKDEKGKRKRKRKRRKAKKEENQEICGNRSNEYVEFENLNQSGAKKFYLMMTGISLKNKEYKELFKHLKEFADFEIVSDEQVIQQMSGSSQPLNQIFSTKIGTEPANSV